MIWGSAVAQEFLPGTRYVICDHVVSPDWDGPLMIRMECWGGKEMALLVAAGLTPQLDDAIAVRVYDQATLTWADDGSPAFKHGVWRAA